MPQQAHHYTRYHINRFIFEKGYAPETSDLAHLMGISEDNIKKHFNQLHDEHALLLHPNSHRIWVAHPFALFPTLFWVKAGPRQWWGNCAWCSLGIASLVESPVEITTTLAGEQGAIAIHIEGGEITEKELFVHFAVPARHFWDNVTYTCANMLVFESRNAVESWCKRHRVNLGEILPIAQVWDLAKLWYGNYLSPDWTSKNAEEAAAIFSRVGLNSAFWSLS